MYKPSNGTEGEIFFSKFCYRCKNYVYDEETGSDDCILNLILAAEINDIDDPDYPDQWTYDKDNKPTCLEFVKEDK